MRRQRSVNFDLERCRVSNTNRDYQKCKTHTHKRKDSRSQKIKEKNLLVILYEFEIFRVNTLQSFVYDRRDKVYNQHIYVVNEDGMWLSVEKNAHTSTQHTYTRALQTNET